MVFQKERERRIYFVQEFAVWTGLHEDSSVPFHSESATEVRRLGWSHLKAQSLKYLALLLRKLKHLGIGRAAAPQAFCELSPHSCPAEMLHGVKLLYCLKLPKVCPKRKKPAQNSKCILLVNAVAKYCPVSEGGGRKYILSLDMGGRQDSERAYKIGNTIVGFLKKSSTKLVTLHL